MRQIFFTAVFISISFFSQAQSNLIQNMVPQPKFDFDQTLYPADMTLNKKCEQNSLSKLKEIKDKIEAIKRAIKSEEENLIIEDTPAQRQEIRDLQRKLRNLEQDLLHEGQPVM